MPGHVQQPLWPSHLARIDLRVQDTFFLLEWPGDELAIRVDDGAISGVDPVVRAGIKALLEGLQVGDV